LSPYTSINSNWNKDLNLRPEALTLVQERAGDALEVIGIGNYAYSATKRKNQQMGLEEIKKLLHDKRNGLN
jgi:hypothetical protein